MNNVRLCLYEGVLQSSEVLLDFGCIMTLKNGSEYKNNVIIRSLMLLEINGKLT